jgi:ABC-type hemin transport system ATPase subunit
MLAESFMDQGAIVAEGGPREVPRADLLTTVDDQPLVVVGHPFRDWPLIVTANDQRPHQ